MFVELPYSFTYIGRWVSRADLLTIYQGISKNEECVREEKKSASLDARNLKLAARPFREGNGTPLQHFCLENPMDGGA